MTRTPPRAASTPQPRDGATGVAVETLLLSWSAAARAASYDVYWGTGRNLAAAADLGTPIGTTFTATTIRRPALGTTYCGPTGTPTPVVTTSPRYRPLSSAWPLGIDFFLWDGNYVFRNAGANRSKGVITLTATNSAGTAKTTVSYATYCHNISFMGAPRCLQRQLAGRGAIN